MKIPDIFFKRIFWIGGIILVLVGLLSFYVRFQTLKYDLRQGEGYEAEIINEQPAP